MIRRKQSQNDNYSEQLRHYSIRGHRIYLIVLLLLTFACSVFLFPLLLKLIYSCFVKWFGESDSIIKLLPDFLGGLVGVLIGFLVDFSIIKRLKHLQEYESLLGVLVPYLNYLIKHIEDTIQKINANPKIKKSDLRGFDYSIIEECIRSTDKLSIFYNLPRYFFFKRKGAIAESLRAIYTSGDENDLTDFNAALDLYLKQLKTKLSIDTPKNTDDNLASKLLFTDIIAKEKDDENTANALENSKDELVKQGNGIIKKIECFLSAIS